MRSLLARVSTALCLGLVAVACATGGNAESDVGGGSSDVDSGASGNGDDAAGGSTNDSGGIANDSGRTENDSGSSTFDSSVAQDTGGPTDSSAPVDAFIGPPDGGSIPDSAVAGGACDTSSQSNQARYAAEFVVAFASSNPKPCLLGCNAAECCYQLLCIPL